MEAIWMWKSDLMSPNTLDQMGGVKGVNLLGWWVHGVIHIERNIQITRWWQLKYASISPVKLGKWQMG